MNGCCWRWFEGKPCDCVPFDESEDLAERVEFVPAPDDGDRESW